MLRFRKTASRRWISAVHKTIVSNLKSLLDYADEYQLSIQQKGHIEWRIAYNLYAAGDFSSAWEMLYKICEDEVNYWISTEVISNYNIIAARCSTELYFETSNHDYLHHAYKFYQRGIETMKFDIYAMFRLPQVLQEYGLVMEHYGAFQAAMQLYSKILGSFPNYRGYFHVMYRTTIVGKYLAEYSDVAQSETFVGQCIDTLQFLLEALPLGIDDVRVHQKHKRALSNHISGARSASLWPLFRSIC
jgi:tetratricopeptide (TPR) repeat protein